MAEGYRHYTKEYINAIDEDNSDTGEETEELNFALDLIEKRWNNSYL